ncbi:MAG: toll/interleukin-1 receptor domain-containing protein, partial [Acutalibacteraceae bacterium]
MSVEYKAFISCCCQPADRSAAAEIHRLLENYPVAYEMKNMGKQMGKIYLETAKPGVSSEPSEDTRTALEHSEYLIVICSESAKESDKTMNELEYFLKTHTADKVIPVIIDGEPENVIPERIMNEKMVLCDWQVSKETAVGIELRKIAAVLLGCSHEKPEKKPEKLKKYFGLFVFCVVFLAFLAGAVYLIVSLVQKKPNIGMVNPQTEYLVSQSLESSVNGDRVKAAALALEAVGTQDANGSYNSDIVLALTKAVMPYTGGNEDFSPKMTYTSNKSKVDDFEFSRDSEYLYTIDRKCNLTIYETESGIELVSVPLNNVTETGGIYSFTVLPDNSVAIQYYSVLYCYGIDGRERWTMEDVYTCLYAENADKLIVMTVDDNKALNVVDYSTGKIKKKITLPDTVCGYTVLADGNANGNNVLLVSKGIPLNEDSDPYYACYL